jgi:WD40 repeat protein/tetratricopeptide (TPR) repeat protein
MNESDVRSVREEVAAYEFPSLALLKAAHLKMLERESDLADPDFLEDVRELMMRISATGRILDDDKERGIAQTLLSYWATVLIRAGVPEEKIPRSSLAEFDEGVGRHLDTSQCPYRGLEAYSESSAHLFFGRKQVIADWLELLREKRVLVVLGPSGSGKTSLIRAGLLPQLRAGALPGSETWKVVDTTLPEENAPQALKTVLETEAKSPRVLLLALRFDEVFLHCDRKGQRRLVAMIARWVTQANTERRVVAAARLELAGVLTRWLHKTKLGSIGKEAFIPPLGARELRAVIEEPAEQIGLRFEEGIVDTLINEFLGDPAALALLQFTLVKLWDRRERNHITWAAYRAIGGGQGAVKNTAEEVYNAADFDEKDRELTKKIFLRLVRPSLTRELVATSVSETALSGDPEEQQRIGRIVERFEKAQLLRVRTDARGERVVEVTHEALLRRWPRFFLQWLEDARIELLQRQRIGMAATQWREQNRHPSALWSGVLLDSALSIRDKLSPSELEFVEASQRAANRRRNRNRLLLTAVILLLALCLLYEIRRTLQERFVGRKTSAVLNLERGERHLESGDPAGAFLFFHQAAVEDPNAKNDLRHRLWRIVVSPQTLVYDPEAGRDWVHRSRLGATWRQLPRLRHLFYLKDLTRSELSPSGEYLVATSRDSVRLWQLKENGASEESNASLPPGMVMWASFHPDLKQSLVAISLEDFDSNAKPAGHGQIVILDAKTNQRVGEPIQFTDAVPQKVWFSPAEAELLMVVSQPTGDGGGEVSLWNFRNGRQEALLRDHTLPVNWAAFSQDGRLVVTAAGKLDGGEKGEAFVWDWKDKNRPPARLQHDGGPLSYAEFASAEFDDNSARMVTAEGANDSSSGAARVWSVRKPPELLEIAAVTAPLRHRGAVNRARFSPDGLWIATASSDHTARLWNVRTQKEVLNFKHNGDVFDVVFSPDGRYLATGARDRTARIWEVATGQPVHAPLNHSETVVRLAYSSDGRSLVTTSRHLVRIWAANRSERKPAPLEVSEPFLTVASDDGQRVLTVSKPDDTQQSTVELWETGTGVRTASIKLGAAVSCAALDADGDRLVVASRDSSGKPVLQVLKVAASGDAEGIWRFEKISELRENIPPDGYIVSAAFDRDGGRLGVVLRSADKAQSSVAIFDVVEGTGRILPGQLPSAISRIQLSPSGKYLLALFTRPGEPEGRAKLWRLDDASAAASELHHSSAITSAAFSAGEDFLLTGGTDDDAQLWKITGGRVSAGEVLREEGSEHTHTADVTRVLFSPDGRRALTASKDQTAILWDLDSRRSIAVLRHSAYVNDAAFSRDGDLVLTSSGEPKLRVWSAKSGELVALFIPSSDVFQVSFAPNGDSLTAIELDSAELSTQADSLAGDQPATRSPRKVRAVIWSFVALQDDLGRARQRGTLLAARQIDNKSLKKAATEDLAKFWESERLAYQALFGAELDSREYHDATAKECQTSNQWFAAAWHLTKLLEASHDDAARANLLLRRSAAYAAADNWADSLPKCISDRKAAIELGLNRAQDYRALAEAYVNYGSASGKEDQWDLAIEVLREGARLNPNDMMTFVRLGEAFAGKRDFAQAEIEFGRARDLGSTAAPARLGLMGWLRGDEQGKQQYRQMCLALGDPTISGWEAFSLLWPTVLTNAFEEDEQYAAFREMVVDRARKLSDEVPSDFHRRNTLGAALYRAGRYEEAIKELEAARAGYLAERANEFSQYYDRLIRIPISRTPEGRPQDWAFLAMANARLNRLREAWSCIRKLRESPELLRATQTQPGARNYPVAYDRLALELLYDEAVKVVRESSAQQRASN